MSEMKCPVCQNNLHKINIIVSTCTNDKCKLWGSSIPNLVLKALAKTNQDLERTRKALDVVAKKAEALKELADIAGFGMLSAGCQDIIEQIPLTTVKQKD